MADKTEVQILQEQVAQLQKQLAELQARPSGGGVVVTRGLRPALSAAQEKVKRILSGESVKMVKVRVSRLVNGKKKGDKVEAAQPITLSATWSKLWKPPEGFPSRLEVGEEYQIPEVMAKSLGPDVQLVG